MSQINTWSNEIMRELENNFVTNFHVKKRVAEEAERKRTLDNVYGTLRKFCEQTRRVFLGVFLLCIYLFNKEFFYKIASTDSFFPSSLSLLATAFCLYHGQPP